MKKITRRHGFSEGGQEGRTYEVLPDVKHEGKWPNTTKTIVSPWTEPVVFRLSKKSWHSAAYIWIIRGNIEDVEIEVEVLGLYAAQATCRTLVETYYAGKLNGTSQHAPPTVGGPKLVIDENGVMSGVRRDG